MIVERIGALQSSVTRADHWAMALSVVNTGIVLVLAIITLWYARSAKRQAIAATEQAKAAQDTLAFLHVQIEEQAQTALATLLGSVQHIRRVAARWQQDIGRPMVLNQTIRVELLSPEWAVSLEKARRVSPELFQNLQDLQQSCREVARSIELYFGTEPHNRSANEQRDIRTALGQIDHKCVGVFNKISPLLPKEYVNALVANN